MSKVSKDPTGAPFQHIQSWNAKQFEFNNIFYFSFIVIILCIHTLFRFPLHFIFALLTSRANFLGQIASFNTVLNALHYGPHDRAVVRPNVRPGKSYLTFWTCWIAMVKRYCQSRRYVASEPQRQFNTKLKTNNQNNFVVSKDADLATCGRRYSRVTINRQWPSGRARFRHP